MCGIFGYTGSKPSASILVDGLKRLEYRGYDSAGAAVSSPDGKLSIIRKAGGTDSVARLDAEIAERSPAGVSGIAHTRWATHGEVAERNAHPHIASSGDIAIVHNGIVENYLELKRDLQAEGVKFSSETDSEVIAHLVDYKVKSGADLLTAVRSVMSRVHGAAAIVAVSAKEPGRIVAARLGNAGGIVIGKTGNEHMVASDIIALLPHTNNVCYLESGQAVSLTPGECVIESLDGTSIEPQFIISSRNADMAAKGRFPHFMSKEIAEQPEAVTAAMRQRVDFNSGKIMLPELNMTPEQVKDINRAVFIGMGTSLHAGMTGATALEAMARIPVSAENASELRYRNPVMDDKTLVVAVTQSGETADTLAAMELARSKGAKQIAVVEAEGTQATRLAGSTLAIKCGPEIGVAATKTMTATMLTLSMLAARFASLRGTLTTDKEAELVSAMSALPGQISRAMEGDADIKKMAQDLTEFDHLLYLGRGSGFPAAMEGALKMKEVAYIHAEGYAAGEMKHGAIALISPKMPTIAIAPRDEMFEKMLSNVSEVKSRGGKVIALTTDDDDIMETVADHVMYVPKTHSLLQPILNVIPMQQLAYHTAVALGLDPDKPRNLAKTVTVE